MSARRRYINLRHEPTTAASDDWRARAACASTDPELFHPIGDSWTHHEADAELAKAICAGCPVVEKCLEWALAHEDKFAIAGGMTPGERATLKRNSRRHPAAKCGTTAGYTRHLRERTPTCQECRDAMTAHKRRYNRAKKEPA